MVNTLAYEEKLVELLPVVHLNNDNGKNYIVVEFNPEAITGVECENQVAYDKLVNIVDAEYRGMISVKS